MRRLLLVLLAAGAGSCATPRGYIYTHTIQPLSTNLDETPFVSDIGRGDVREIDYYVRIQWGANGVGDIAKASGMSEVYYADLETLSVLGVWTQQWAHVYGRR